MTDPEIQVLRRHLRSETRPRDPNSSYTISPCDCGTPSYTGVCETCLRDKIQKQESVSEKEGVDKTD